MIETYVICKKHEMFVINNSIYLNVPIISNRTRKGLQVHYRLYANRPKIYKY